MAAGASFRAAGGLQTLRADWLLAAAAGALALLAVYALAALVRRAHQRPAKARPESPCSSCGRRAAATARLFAAPSSVTSKLQQQAQARQLGQPSVFGQHKDPLEHYAANRAPPGALGPHQAERQRSPSDCLEDDNEQVMDGDVCRASRSKLALLLQVASDASELGAEGCGARLRLSVEPLPLLTRVQIAARPAERRASLLAHTLAALGRSRSVDLGVASRRAESAERAYRVRLLELRRPADPARLSPVGVFARLFRPDAAAEFAQLPVVRTSGRARLADTPGYTFTCRECEFPLRVSLYLATRRAGRPLLGHCLVEAAGEQVREYLLQPAL